MEKGYDAGPGTDGSNTVGYGGNPVDKETYVGDVPKTPEAIATEAMQFIRDLRTCKLGAYLDVKE